MKKVVKKIAFLDRDGALIYEPPTDYQVDSIEKLQILGGVIEGLQWLQTQDYVLAMITNQDGLGTAAFPRSDFDAPHEGMLNIFSKYNIYFTKVFICPHFVEDKCLCRKPQTGLVDYWLTTFELDYDNSFMYGDRPTDREFAENLGIRFIYTPTNQAFNLQAFNF